ncbi:MAG TPA: hypothetical protein VHB21_22590 [Minicystis sp.]|nr:hypothetical protein [Minicystis sp.]
MIPTIDVTTLSGPAQKIASPAAPEKMQEMAAKGVAPGVRPGELLSVLVLLSKSERDGVRAAAQKTLSALPEPLLQGALSQELPPAVLDVIARAYATRPEVLERLLQMSTISAETVEDLARTSNEQISELIATNEERLLRSPRIIEALYLNKSTRMSTADRLVELAVRNGIQLTGIAAFKEASIAIQNELVVEPSDEPTPDDLLFQETQQIAEQLAEVAAPEEDTHDEDEEGKEKLKNKFLPLWQRVATMTTSQKIRAAMLGSKEERMMLVRDHNRIVASAAVRSPLMQESEAVLISRNRNMPDEVLRVIASTPEWLKSYAIKKNLCENPKTPASIATRLVLQLRESDLRHLAKSKNVSGPVQDAARRHLDRRKS